MKARKFGLGLRFSLIVGAILLFFCAVFSTILYYYLRAQVIKEAEVKTMIIMTQFKALGDYVRDSLRPKMFDILSEVKSDDEFILEAMSTTKINFQVMRQFNKYLPDYTYQRVSDRPLNVKNTADGFHRGMMQYFEKHRDQDSWHGIVKAGGKELLVCARPVISERGCLVCHGEPEKVSPRVYRKYREAGRFGWKAGSVAGVESVSVPLDIAFAQVKKAAIDTFIFGLGTLWFLFVALYGTFRHLVTTPLNNLSRIFRGIAGGTEPLGRDIPIAREDEIGDLTGSFNILAKHLLDAQELLRKTAELEKQMMETEKLAALGQLSAGVAHEINNPLGGVRLCFNNLTNTAMNEDMRRQHIEVINSGLGRIQSIVRHLLDFSKNSPLSLAPSTINRIIENVLKLAEFTVMQKGIRLVKELSSEIPELLVDSNKLEQVFLNLIINAVQAMNGEGVLRIRTWYAKGLCNISFEDTGKGIPRDIITKIFDPFFTTKGVGEGTGLGLTVSKAIVEQHKGTMDVETSDSGAIFTVRLPIMP